MANSIPVETVEHTAHLARLRSENLERMAKDLSDIVAQADLLGNLDTTGIEPTNHAMPLQNIFREDILDDSFPRDEMLQNATAKAGCYVVPKTFEGE